jgi:nitroimidazol reductase NimA-like FMN-containing flavoprotein (pyridoxamine 5'-phosphate oxidase superfamily)
MDRPTEVVDRGRMNTTNVTPDLSTAADPTLGRLVHRAVAKRSFAVLATASVDGRAHAAGVLYQLAGGELWVSTMRSSRKARNVAANAAVAVTVPVRRLPVGPPSSVMLQGTATVVELDDPKLRRLADEGALKQVTSHGELELPGGCFLRVRLPQRVPVYGLGMSLWALLRDPLASGRIAHVDW